MTIQALYPDISPSLSLDFANVKQLDPRVTFARASTARYYDGKTVAKAEENLLLRSQDYSATWSVTNLTPVTGKTAPDATTTATEFTASAGNATLTQSVTAIAGDYTFSVFLRRVSGTGDVDISAHSAGTWVTQTLTSTWTRFTVTQTLTAGARTPGIRVVTSGDVIEVWGAQLEQRSTVTAYTATTTQPITNYIPVLLSAADNEARFDHNPTTSESLGLLIEEQRSNLFTRSEEFDNADWTKSNATITANTVVAPDGLLTGDKLIEDATTATHFIRESISLTTGNKYTSSIFVKAAERTSFRFQYGTTAGAFPALQTANFDLSDLSATPSSNGIASITPVGNDWYRCVFTTDTTTSTQSMNIQILLRSGGVASYTGDGTSGLFIWGAQLEAGAFPTSYIPTVASQVTRSADAASMTGTNFSSWYRADEGSVYSEAQPFSITVTGGIWSIGNPSFSFANRTKIDAAFAGGNTGRATTAVNVNGVVQATLVNTYTQAINAFTKTTLGYKTADFGLSTNGLTAATVASGTLPVVNSFSIGSLNSSWASGGTFLNGHIRKFAFYPKRLTNVQLQAITT